ncbi:hypothetical protein LTS02_004233 [Friedmanniomyces endolithicus]|nr:hypothetical protein LTS02_004233 [Friedmanniomyces endolithicus]
MPSIKRPIRIAGSSGGFTDRQRAILSLAHSDVDVIVGDWMSECTMSWHGAAKAELAAQGISDEDRAGLYDPSFMANLTPALGVLQEKGIKIAVNAGASDTEKLAKVVVEAVREQGLDLKVAWIEGDEVMEAVRKLMAGGEKESDFDQIASSLMAGHLIECSSYVCGGYYSGFKDLFDGCENVGFPIAEIHIDGSFYMEKEANTGGEMSVGTCASQLLYEIQGPQYYGSDAVALLEGIQMTQVEKDKVYVSGVKGNPPPTTTKVGITAKGGWQAEFHYLLCGLDLEQKAEWTERQVRHSMGPNASRFSCLKFSLNGSCPADPRNQDVATADLRVFVQTKDRSLVVRDSMEVPGFNRWCMENFLQSCPGATIENDIRQSAGKEFYEYWAALLPQREVRHRVHLMWDGRGVDIAVPEAVVEYGYQRGERQWSYETRSPVELGGFGPSTRAPLGWVVLGRSGDKASDANIGFFVRQDDEYQWLCSLLTIPKIKQLLGPEYNGKGVDRFEIPGIRAVHFLLHDHLDRSYNASSTYDGLGKNVCEYLRAKHVEVPNKFLRRGRV